jgi:hypothetical protein
MPILEVIATTLRTGTAQPTTVLNALIHLENNGGMSALHELEYRLSRLEFAMQQRADESVGICTGWLQSTRAYIEVFTVEPAPVAQTLMDKLRQLGVRR